MLLFILAIVNVISEFGRGNPIVDIVIYISWILFPILSKALKI